MSSQSKTSLSEQPYTTFQREFSSSSPVNPSQSIKTLAISKKDQYYPAPPACALSSSSVNALNLNKNLAMNGKVRTRERCPKCNQKYRIIEEIDIICDKCGTRPKTFFIFLYWHRKKYRISRDRDGHILDSYRRALRLLEKIRSEIDEHKFIIKNYLPKEIEQFRGKFLFLDWIKNLEAKKNAKSYLSKIRQYTRDHFIPKLGQINMMEIKTYDIEKFHQYITNNYRIQKNGLPLSPKTVKNIMDALKEFCNWLYRNEVIIRIPHFEPVRVPEKLIEVMPLEDRSKAFAAISSTHLKNIIGFLIHHPVRPSEACALDVCHFNLVDRNIVITQALDSDHSIKPRKNRKAYEIPLSCNWDSSCIQHRFGCEIAFPNKDGKRYNANTLNGAWRRACAKAGVNYVSLYPATRHTTATLYALNGAREEDIEAMLGQETRGMSKRYVKRSVEMLRPLVDGTQVVHISKKSDVN